MNRNLGQAHEQDPKPTIKLTHSLRFAGEKHILENVIHREDYRLSPSYTKPANPYLITNANTLPAT